MDIADWVLARGIRSARSRNLTAFVFGFVGALAFSPTCFFAVLAVCFPALVVLLRTAPTLRAAFVTGWSFGFGYFLLGLYWIATALFVDIAEFWWAVPFAVAGLPAVCAIFYGLSSVVAKRIGLNGVSGALCFALCWFLADYARGHVLTGFPWNLEGYVWSDVLPMMQITSVIGVYGLTLLTLVVASLCIAFFEVDKRSKRIAVFAVTVMLGVGLWGADRLYMGTAYSSASIIRVVQPNVEQSEKWSGTAREAHFQQLLNLSSMPADKTPAVVVWPETASTFYLEEDIDHRRAIAAILGEGEYLLTGVIRRFLNDEGKLHFANSLVALDRTGRIAASYDKFHLVPFGEYIPLRRVLSLRTLANLGVDFTAGQGLRTLHLDGLPTFSPLICYEAIFPNEVAVRDDRPQILINITNDGWYGRTAGPYQHFVIARTRAIEEGIPLVRSANTGISAVIDAYGRIVVKLDLGKSGIIDVNIPEVIAPTLFSKQGDHTVWGLFVFLAMICWALRWFKKVPN